MNNYNHMNLTNGASALVWTDGDHVTAEHHSSSGVKLGEMSCAAGFGLLVGIDGAAPIAFEHGDDTRSFYSTDGFICARVVIGLDGIARTVRA